MEKMTRMHFHGGYWFISIEDADGRSRMEAIGEKTPAGRSLTSRSRRMGPLDGDRTVFTAQHKRFN